MAKHNNNKKKAAPKQNMAAKEKMMAAKAAVIYPAVRLKAMTQRPPKQTNVGKRGVRVVNREIIMQLDRTFVAGSAPFGVNTRRLGFTNAADTGSGLFGFDTWLGRYATLYDRFRIHKIDIYFAPVLASTHSGQVAMYCDADFEPRTPTTYLQMSANDGVSAKQVSWANHISYNANHFNRLPWYDTSQIRPDTGTAGVIFVATSTIASPVAGFAATYTSGYVWMEYDIEFSIPSNPSSATIPTTVANPLNLLPIQQMLEEEYKDEIRKQMDNHPEFTSMWSESLAALSSYLALTSPRSRGRKSPGVPDQPPNQVPSSSVETPKPDQGEHDELKR
jgi:hypothetical protein